MKRNLVVITVIGAAITFMVWAGARHAVKVRSTSQASGVGTAMGQQAPDFELVDLKTGNKVHLSDFRGKAVLLNFWATWCPPCRVEIPWFIDFQKQYGSQGLQVIGVAMDDAGRDSIESFANNMGINYLVVQGTDQVANAYGGVEGLPTSFYLDRDGRVVKTVTGLVSHAEAEQNVKLVLARGTLQSATAPIEASSQANSKP